MDDSWPRLFCQTRPQAQWQSLVTFILSEPSAELGAAIIAQMINLTLHERLLADRHASIHIWTTPQTLQAKALRTQ